MNKLVKFYQNPVNKETEMAVGFINKMAKQHPAMIGEINVIGNAKLVVVGVPKIATTQSIVISMGVARCTPIDEFDKEQGIEYATWRAENASQVQFSVPAATPQSDIIAMFNRLADVLNNRFIEKSETQALPKLPVELLSKYVVSN